MTAAPASTAVDIYERSNLTRLQLLFWVGQRLRPEIPLFNTIQIFTIPTKVEPGRLQSAFQTLVDHSDALRTVLEEIEGVPQQKVAFGFSNSMEYFDFSKASEPHSEFQSWLQQRSVIPLNLEKRLFDSALVKIAEKRFVWYLNQHHIITDAASSFLAFERLAQLYERPLNGEVTSTPLVQPFADYVRYERAYRNSPQYARSAAYWKQKLSRGPRPILFFGQQPIKKTSRVQRVSHDLGLERSQKIREIARQKEIFTVSEELSLSTIFAALLCTQLHFMSGSDRLGLLVPVHNRFSPTFKNTLGLLMEYCPLQISVSADDSFQSLITKVKRETRETFTHYQYGSGLSLQDQAFDVIFNMYQVPAFQLCGAPVEVERIYPGFGSERLALHVNDDVRTGKIEVHFDFSCDVFDADQQQQTLRNFVQLIDTFLEDSAQTIRQLSLAQTRWNPSALHSSDVNIQERPTAITDSGLPDRNVVAPRDELEGKLIQIWERVLGIHPIGIRDNFFNLGASSWQAVRLFAEIERAMGIPLPLRLLIQAGTVEDLAKTIRENQEPKPWSPLVAIQGQGTRSPFYCVHGAGGHILLFDRVARHLGHDQPFLAFQAHGIEEGQEPFKNIEEMAAYYIQALRKAQPEGPYFLGGYSMGGMVAFEMAQQLRAQSQIVAALAIIDVPAQSPRLIYLRQVTERIGRLLRMNREKRLQLFLRLRHYLFRLNYFGRLKLSKKIAYIGSKLSELGRESAETNSQPVDILQEPAAALDASTDVDSQAKQRIRKLSSINEMAFRAYIPQRYQGHVAIIRSARGYTGDADKDYSADPYIGWGRIISGTIESYEVPGDHNEMIREPHVSLLANHLQTYLDNAQRQLDRSGTSQSTTRMLHGRANTIGEISTS